MEMAALAERGVRRAEELGASEAELYVVRERLVRIEGVACGLERVECGEEVTAVARVLVGRRLALQSSVIAVEEDVYRLVEGALRVARASEEDPHWHSLPKTLGKSPTVDLVDPRIAEGEVDHFAEIVSRAVSLPTAIDRRARAVRARVAASRIERAVANSYQSPVSEVSTYFNFSITVKASDERGESTYYGYHEAPTLREFNMEAVVEEATRVAVGTIGAKAVPAGGYQALFMPRFFASLLSSLLVPAVRADLVQRERSPLRGRLYSQVLSGQLTIIDDGCAPNMVGSGAFDEEGVPTRRKVVFDGGVLTTYLYDTYTANIEGRASTGNARRSGGSNVHPDATNIIVLPGTSPLESLVREVRRGLVIYDAIGSWLSNYVSGLMNATITHAYYVENGEVRHPVKGVVISGNVYTILREGLVAVSREVELVSNYLVPAAMVSEVTVASE